MSPEIPLQHDRLSMRADTANPQCQSLRTTEVGVNALSNASLHAIQHHGAKHPPLTSCRTAPHRTAPHRTAPHRTAHLKMGCTIEKHSTGAATLLIHMDANVATNMDASSTLCGRRPTRDSTATASCLQVLLGGQHFATTKVGRCPTTRHFNLPAQRMGP
jgi:hypothetical protein